MKRVAVLLADGFEEVEAITQIDYLRRARVETVAAGLVSREVTGSHDIRLLADTTVAELDGTFDGIVVPGGMAGARAIAADDRAVALIRGLLAEGKLVAAICAAPAVVLGAHGLLAGRRYTCYPGLEKQAGPGTHVEQRVVVDGNLVTSRGPGTAAEFALAIVECLVGPEAAGDLRRATLQRD